jgi:hypothetical protein
MHPELRDFIQQADFDRPSVQRVVELLPADDAELDRYIDQTIERIDVREFRFVIVAALVAGCPVDARHLVKSISMLAADGFLMDAALRMQGEVGEFLVDGLKEASFPADIDGQVLCLAAVWCTENRNGVIPDQLLPRARRLARLPIAGLPAFSSLLVAAVNTKDKNLLTLLRRQLPNATDDEWKDLLES